MIDADIKGFFDNVDHDILLDIVNEKVSDGSILKLIRKFLEAGVLKDGEFMETTVGTPQGGVISPLLANIYLHHLDRRLEERGYRFVRYADDFLVFCNTKEEAEHGLQFIKQVLKEELKLDLNTDKTSIAYISYKRYEKGKQRPERKDINFLGFRINRYHTVPRKRSVERFKDKIRQETKRSWTRDTKEMIHSINRKIRGWANYYKHGSVKTLFSELDAWIRTRIRLNLGKRKVKDFKLNKHYMSISKYKYTNRDLLKMGLKSLSRIKEKPPAP